jgi:hypothetical protein
MTNSTHSSDPLNKDTIVIYRFLFCLQAILMQIRIDTFTLLQVYVIFVNEQDGLSRINCVNFTRREKRFF